MIPIDVIETTANDLMAKAAIEIPEDYLTGLKKAADTEDGDLSSYVLHAMLKNHTAAKEDGRAMCGDTGIPRWYVKMGNGTVIEGGPVALEAALRRAQRTPPRMCRCARTGRIRCGARIMITMSGSARLKSNMAMSPVVNGST